jgi:hypothetical protein
MEPGTPLKSTDEPHKIEYKLAIKFYRTGKTLGIAPVLFTR